ncbi:hypothetical protein Caka_2893 [Coraliomargarita akajimensis DSM 45221]|uniref:Uncharacterized protein n=2 Tax=Coraliomargarita TaxID=442430 RepID=D5ER62_CORAD|nr:hypothetical protein Caka_2893 [Coraliomargarita akajimensis DSM 45221]
MLGGCSKEIEAPQAADDFWSRPNTYNQALIEEAIAIILKKYPDEVRENLKVERIDYSLDTGSIRASELIVIRILRLNQRFLTADRTEKYNAQSFYYRVRFKPNGELEGLSRPATRLSLNSNEYDEALELGFIIKED